VKESAEYYRRNKKARDKKNAYQKEYNKKPREVAKRVELNRVNRQAQKRGTAKVGDGKDASHIGGKIVMESAKVNRARREKSRLKGSKRG
jgi:hypothetical protein